MDWYRETFHVTVVLVAASLLLAAPGSAGLGVSVPLLGGFVVLAGVLFALRERLAAGPTVLRHDLGSYGATLWGAPLVAAGVCLLALDASPAELTALGGLVGLVGMANYFLRPVYRAGYVLARRATGTV